MKRVAVCTGLAVLLAHFARYQVLRRPIHADFGQVWYAARAVLHGQDPYALIGPGRAFEWAAPLFYPLWTALVGVPFAPFSEATAVTVFMAAGAFGLCWALTEHGYGPLWALCSVPVYQCFEIAQWAPLMAGAYAIPLLSAVLIAKPTIGAAVFVAKPSRWAFIGGGLLVLLAFVLQPGWVPAWRHALQSASVGNGSAFPYTAPVTFPGGVLILTALSRWRRPEARLLVALGCVPQTTLPYEALLLFLIPRAWWQALGLAALSWAMLAFTRWTVHPVGLTAYITAYGPMMTVWLYLPCTLMVLRRPNEGAVPAWLEQRITEWPAWLRGAPVRA